ncbi:hypothetical protein C5F50_09025 [Nitrosopumilus ureiphilus]|uniref:Transposase n=1 Tax=Nitrosopumilus ureiphilus TaxID=1470067 RepID=A0A7D5REN8_9ARCH|nr:hypothetical protein C5F50_09025 [Nitrosopumilus ureiphilus]
MRATKSIKQKIPHNNDLDSMMSVFTKMINQSIKIGLKNNCSTLKRLSTLAYYDLDSQGLVTSYKLNAVSQACGILSRRELPLAKARGFLLP